MCKEKEIDLRNSCKASLCISQDICTESPCRRHRRSPGFVYLETMPPKSGGQFGRKHEHSLIRQSMSAEGGNETHRIHVIDRRPLVINVLPVPPQDARICCPPAQTGASCLESLAAAKCNRLQRKHCLPHVPKEARVSRERLERRCVPKEQRARVVVASDVLRNQRMQ